MEQLGTNFNATGSVMNRQQLEDLRRKRGECVHCGQKCFKKKLFKSIPIDEPGKVLNGRCLHCRPLDVPDGPSAVARPATKEELELFSRRQSGLLGRKPSSDSTTPCIGSTPSTSSRPRLGARSQSLSATQFDVGFFATAAASTSSAVLQSPTPSLSPRTTSTNLAVPSSVSQQPESARPKSTLPMASSAGASSDSQALPLPPPPAESPYIGRSLSPVTPASAPAPAPASAQSSDDRKRLSRFVRASSRRSLVSTRSGQSLRSNDSSVSNSSTSANYSNLNGNTITSLPLDLSPQAVLDERIPTAEDIEKATLTILAAHKYGKLNEDLLQPEEYDDVRAYDHDHAQEDYDDQQDDYNDRQEDCEHEHHDYNDQDENFGAQHEDFVDQQYDYDDQHDDFGNDRYEDNSPNGSLRSASSLGDDDGPDEFEIPRHGILNRGGEFAFKGTNVVESSRQFGAHVVSGSSRTLSSMSSVEDEHLLHSHINGHLGRTQSLQRLAPRHDDTFYEAPDEGTIHSMQSRNSAIQGRTTIRSNQYMDDYLERLQEAGTDYSEILTVLREAIASDLVVKECLQALSGLQLTPEDQDFLADMDAPHVIADAMEAHGDILEVQVWGCGAIWNLSGTLRNQISFVDAGALDLIFAAMDNFEESIDVQEKAMATLSNLGAAEGNLSILVDRGAVGRIVDAMNKHVNIGSVQIRGCSAVTNLASHISPLKKRIMDLGGGGAVVISMVMHPNDFYLQEKALRALRNLCANHENNKVVLAKIGGIDAVISAMQVHRDEAGVQEEGAWTLSNLAGIDANKAVIGDNGGIDVIIRAMWVHSDRVGVQEWCCRALFTLTIDEQNRNVVLEVGGISAVVNAMQAHSGSPAVQEMGCAVLGNIAVCNPSKIRVVEEEALDAVALAMVLHSADAQVQERACMLLLRLAIIENFGAMKAANIGQLVRLAAENFPRACDEPARRLLHVLHGV